MTRKVSSPVVAIVGATGAVGVEFLRCLERRRFPLSRLLVLASPLSSEAEGVMPVGEDAAGGGSVGTAGGGSGVRTLSGAVASTGGGSDRGAAAG